MRSPNVPLRCLLLRHFVKGLIELCQDLLRFCLASVVAVFAGGLDSLIRIAFDQLGQFVAVGISFVFLLSLQMTSVATGLLEGCFELVAVATVDVLFLEGFLKRGQRLRLRGNPTGSLLRTQYKVKTNFFINSSFVGRQGWALRCGKTVHVRRSVGSDAWPVRSGRVSWGAGARTSCVPGQGLGWVYRYNETVESAGILLSSKAVAAPP